MQSYMAKKFKIKEVFSDGVPYYHLVDMKGEDVMGTIYEQNIVKYVPTGRFWYIVFKLFLEGHF